MSRLRHWLLVISDRHALAWILSEQRMAFAPSRYRLIDTLAEGDLLVIYTSRMCFGNPGRDRGRVVGTATVTSPLRSLETPVTFGDRQFNRDCSLRIERLTPVDQGPELASLVNRLRTFPEAWRIHIRRTLVPLDEHDYATLDKAISGTDIGREAALPTYLDKINPRGFRKPRTD